MRATTDVSVFPMFFCRNVKVVVFWLVSGVIIGVFIAFLFWCGDLLFNGRSIRKAIGGELEDAWGTLQALVVLGSLVGGGVGFLNGLGKVLNRPRPREGTDLTCPRKDNGTA
ncbi:MAG: hypothetical protein NNA18_10400 [Nitrospira sp.]|nr:hypothetical protein [Nitrospira sp.]